MTLNPTTAAPPSERLGRRLDDPEVAAALNVVLDHADLLAVMVEGLSGFIERGDTITEAVVEGVDELRSAATNSPALAALDDVDTQALLDNVTRLAATLPTVAPALAAAAESGIVEKLTRSVVRGVEVDAAHPAPISGPISLFKAVKDDDVARALGFFLTIAKSIGRELDTPEPTTTSTSTTP